MIAWCERCEKPAPSNCRRGARLTDQRCATCSGELISIAEAQTRLGVVYRGDDYILPDNAAVAEAGRAGFDVPDYHRTLEAALIDGSGTGGIAE